MTRSKPTTIAKAAAKSEVSKKNDTTVTVASNTPYQLNPEQTVKACKALIKFIGSKDDNSAKKNLLADEEGDVQTVWLNFTTKKFAATAKKMKPILVSLPHPLHDVTTTTICLIVKDPQRTYKDLIAAAGLTSTVTRIISITKLRAKFKSFESRRLLRDSHDLFLADDSVVRMLPAALGKTFYANNSKIPIPIELKPDSAEKLKRKIEKALSCTKLHLTQSATQSMRVGLSSFSGEQVAENIQAVVNNVLEGKKLPGGWRGTRSIHVKSPSSVALPIWMTPQLFDKDDVLTPEMTAAREKKALERQEKREEKRAGRDLKRKQIKAARRKAAPPAPEGVDVDMEDAAEKPAPKEKLSKSAEKLVDASIKEQKRRKKVVDVLDKGLDASMKEAKKLRAKKL